MKTLAKITMILSSCLLLLYLYCIRDSAIHWITHRRLNHTSHDRIKSTYGYEAFLIKTPGCSLPDYAKYISYNKIKYTKEMCGPRAVFVHQVNDKIVFKIDRKKLQKYIAKKRKVTCCFRFGSTVPGTPNFDYTKCTPFQSGKKFKQLQEVISVTCTTRYKKTSDVVYEDSYILVKKINKKKKRSTNSWNILLLGMSTMSRARVSGTMQRTVQYLQMNKWLDFKGYHTVGDNILTNIIALLTGKKMTTMNEYCTEAQKCNETFVWRHFSNAGYVTAFGDDYLEIPDGLSIDKFTPPSTDHSVWPYFHVKYRRRKGNFICTSNEASGKQLLDYAYQFVDTYKTNNFFGMFWVNTFSSRIQTTPTLIDADIAEFFQNINKTGILNNTFIIFLSDHGTKSADIQMHKEFFYERRLPMFFMWVPYEFQKRYPKEFNNIQINQYRLISPYDVYLTMLDVLKSPSINKTVSEACPKCTSLFEIKSSQRKCGDAGVNSEWCACHLLKDRDGNDERLSQSIELVASHIQNISKVVKTIPCMTCAELHLKNVTRIYSYTSNNKMYYVIALQMSPGNVSYEATVLDDRKDLRIVLPITSISRHGRGNCAINPNDRIFCICDITICNIDLVISLYKNN